MNIIHIFLMVGLWIIAIVKGKQYFILRDAHIRTGEQEQPTECRNAKKVFISSLIAAIIYTLIKLFG